VRRRIYWTDRGDNTVSSAPMDPPPGRAERKVLVSGLRERIGIALDPASGRLFYTRWAARSARSGLDGATRARCLQGQGR
jgi:hypothetical protein